jgi:DNA end-binding protein Ku
MAARYSWKGFLKLSLVSIPVKAYPAASSGERIALNQLHDKCHSRIKYRKVCPVHGEVAKDEIVSGYEYSKGQYVIIEPGEIDKLRTDADRAINLDAVIAEDALDPIYMTEKTYYLVPDGDVGQKPFVLLRDALAAENRQAVARVVMFGREELMVVRPLEAVLSMTALKYPAEVREPSVVADEVASPELKKQEIDLTRSLLEAFVQPDFDLAQYRDEYVEKLRQLIEAKVEGKEVVAPAQHETPQVINLMEALKKSIASASKQAPAKSAKPYERKVKVSPPAERKAASKRKRRSGAA